MYQEGKWDKYVHTSQCKDVSSEPKQGSTLLQNPIFPLNLSIYSNYLYNARHKILTKIKSVCRILSGLPTHCYDECEDIIEIWSLVWQTFLDTWHDLVFIGIKYSGPAWVWISINLLDQEVVCLSFKAIESWQHHSQVGQGSQTSFHTEGRTAFMASAEGRKWCH